MADTPRDNRTSIARTPQCALAYAARGWPVLPLFEIGGDGRCACGGDCGRDAGKHPRTKRGFKDASTDQAKVGHWWAQWPHANIGIATGDGLSVVDIDGPRGQHTISTLQHQHGVMQATYAVRTGREEGGTHHYFATPHRVKVASRVLGPGVDLKADGGYVVAPPSVHRSGRLYTVVANLPLADAAAWIVGPSGFADADPAHAERKQAGRYPAWLPERVEVGDAHGPGRHKMLQRFAGWLRGCGYGEDTIVAELREVVRTRVEQPVDDTIPDSWIVKLAHDYAQKPTTRFSIRERLEPVARTWKGTAGRTDRRVLFTYVLPTFIRYMKLGERAVPLPTLNVANAADIGDRTAALSIKRLRFDRNMLQLAGRRTQHEEANRYQLRPLPPFLVPTKGCVATAKLRSLPSRLRENATVLRELFRHEAFGHVAGDIYSILRDDAGQQPAVLADEARCALSSVYRVCPRMAAHGLVVKASDGWRRVVLDGDALAAIARKLGVLGKTLAEWERRELKRRIYGSASSKRQRERQGKRRAYVQRRLLALAERKGWPTSDSVSGESEWRALVRTQTTRVLSHMLARILGPPAHTIQDSINAGSNVYSAPGL